MAGALSMLMTKVLASLVTRWFGGKLAGRPQQFTVRYPIPFHLGQAGDEEVGKRGPLEQDGAPLLRRIPQDREALAGQVGLLLVLGHVEAHGAGAAHVDADPVHALARGAGAP